jgi:hypothetical protein
MSFCDGLQLEQSEEWHRGDLRSLDYSVEPARLPKSRSGVQNIIISQKYRPLPTMAERKKY